MGEAGPGQVSTASRSPRKEGGDGSMWQRGTMDDTATPPSLQPISTIPLLRPMTMT